MNEEVQAEAKIEPDFKKLDKDKDGKYIVTEDLDPTPIKYVLVDDTLNMQPERYDTYKEAEEAMAKLEGKYTIAEVR